MYRNELKWQNTALPGTPNKIAGWDGDGNPVEVDPSGESYTFENGVVELSPNIVGLGGSLSQDTTIGSGGVPRSFQMGTFTTDPLNGFAVYSQGAITFSYRNAAGTAQSLIQMGSEILMTTRSNAIRFGNTVSIADALPLMRYNKIGTSNALNIFSEYSLDTTGGVGAAGLAMRFTYGIENEIGTQAVMAAQTIEATDVTSTAETGKYTLSVKLAGVLTDYLTIQDGAVILNLPTSSAGLPSGALWRDAGAANVIKMVP
jgi:hypothetical protein